METLESLHPRIRDFLRAVESSMAARFYPAKPAGRASDGWILVLEGSTDYAFSDGTAFTVHAGDLFYLARGSVYTMQVRSARYAFIFTDFFFDLPDGVSLPSTLLGLPAGAAEGLFRRLLAKWTAKKPGYLEDCFSLLYTIYAEILRARSAAYLPSDKRRQLEKGVRYLEGHYADESLTVGAIAAAAELSESHFRRLYRAAYGVPPLRSISLLRLERAKELICYSDLTFTEIARRTGFSDVYYFSRMFKREVGCTPSEYKNAHADVRGT